MKVLKVVKTGAKLLGKIGTFQDIKEEYNIQGWKGIFVSRKFWSLFWIIGGEVLRDNFGVDIDSEMQKDITEVIVTWASFAMELFGAIMGLISWLKYTLNRIIASRDKKG